MLATASPNWIRLTLLRIGAVVLRNTRRIRLLLSSACPYQGCSGCWPFAWTRPDGDGVLPRHVDKQRGWGAPEIRETVPWERITEGIRTLETLL